MKSALEETFALHCQAYKLKPVREFRFHPTRRWQFDFAWPAQFVAVECEGGIWTNGRHTRGAGVIGDMNKYNEAARMGWAVFRFEGKSIRDGSAVQFMSEVLSNKRGGA